MCRHLEIWTTSLEPTPLNCDSLNYDSKIVCVSPISINLFSVCHVYVVCTHCYYSLCKKLLVVCVVVIHIITLVSNLIVEVYVHLFIISICGTKDRQIQTNSILIISKSFNSRNNDQCANIPLIMSISHLCLQSEICLNSDHQINTILLASRHGLQSEYFVTDWCGIYTLHTVKLWRFCCFVCKKWI